MKLAEEPLLLWRIVFRSLFFIEKSDLSFWYTTFKLVYLPFWFRSTLYGNRIGTISNQETWHCITRDVHQRVECILTRVQCNDFTCEFVKRALGACKNFWTQTCIGERRMREREGKERRKQMSCSQCPALTHLISLLSAKGSAVQFSVIPFSHYYWVDPSQAVLY